MTSTLEGAFISYSATFQEVNALGATNISLVNSVAIHEMNHIVRITVPSDDGIPDFLVNDTTNVDALPDNVYSSTGPVFPVTSLTNVTVTGTLSGTQSNVTATVAAPPGWVYLQFPDPSGGTMTIASVHALRRRQPAGRAQRLADARARSTCCRRSRRTWCICLTTTPPAPTPSPTARWSPRPL